MFLCLTELRHTEKFWEHECAVVESSWYYYCSKLMTVTLNRGTLTWKRGSGNKIIFINLSSTKIDIDFFYLNREEY